MKTGDRAIRLIAGIILLFLGLEHGTAYFVLSGSWKGDTPLAVDAALLVGAIVIAVAIFSERKPG